LQRRAVSCNFVVMETNKVKKRCPRCEKRIDLAQFHRNSKNLDGHACWCIPCERTYYRAYYCQNKGRAKERSRKYEKTPKGRWCVYTRGARAKGLVWQLTQTYFFGLISRDCHWCGGPGGGVDRVDSTRGYTKDNCVPCCKICNVAKNDLSVHEFLTWARRLSKHLPALGR
jgi:hypothetical protein